MVSKTGKLTVLLFFYILIYMKCIVPCKLRGIQTIWGMFKKGEAGQEFVFKELKTFSLEKRRYRKK